MVAEGVEGYPVDLPVMGIVVLNKFSQSGVPYFNGAIDCRCSDACSVRGEFAAENL